MNHAGMTINARFASHVGAAVFPVGTLILLFEIHKAVGVARSG